MGAFLCAEWRTLVSEMDQVQMVLDRVNERITQTTPATQRLLLRTTTLVLIYILAFVARLHPIIRFETMIHEFDPYFNYRATQYLIEHGPVSFHNWFDPTVWYPLGRAVGFTIYPGLMWTAALVHWILNAIGIAANVRHVCVFLSPWMASNTAIVTYFLAKEVRNEETGLIAAAFMAIVHAYISRSVAGSFDNEGVAIFAMVLTFYCFVKSVRKGSLLWSAFASLSYFYMSASWGGYVFIINLIPLYVIVMMVTGRYTNRLYIAYSSFYVMGTLLSMQIRFIGFQPVQSAEHLLALATFAAVQLHAVYQAIDNFLPPSSAQWLQQGLTTALGVAGALVGLGLQISGWELPWSPRFYAALDPSYAKEWQPIIASVSEHQPPSWATFFFDIMKRLDVDYVMVVFGGLSGYGSDDINKFLWMVRIGSSIDPTIDEAEYFTKTGEFRVDAQGSPKTLNCLMYKLCYYRFGEMKMDESLPAGFDRVRNVEIGSKNIELEHVEEAFTSKNWMVRIYQVKRPENRW